MSVLLRHRRQDSLCFAAAVIVAFLIYLRTLAPGILPGDSGELQFAAWGWTLAHPTGYPLYLILGGVWQHLVPFGDPAYRLNLFSAVWSALTVGLSYAVFNRVTANRGAALVAALAFAVSPLFWSQATETEVYALNSFFVVLLTCLALKWGEARDFKYSAAWALAFGLALTHHRSIILLVPGFAAFFAQAIHSRAQRTRSRTFTAASLRRDAAYALLALAPLLLYAYVPLRAAATPYAHISITPEQTITTFENTPRGWLAHILGTSFGSELSLDATSLKALGQLPGHLLAQFNPVGAALGLLGLFALLLRRQLNLAALTLFGFAGIVVFASAYHIGDIRDYYTPAYFFFGLWLAAGLGAILDVAGSRLSPEKSLIPVILVLVVAAAIPLENLYTSFTEQDRSLQTNWGARWREVLGSDLPRNSILISNDRDEITPMWYLQLVEGIRPDLIGLFPRISPDPGYSNVVRVVESVSDAGRPVLLIKDLPGIALRYRLEPVPPELYRVSTAAWPTPQFSARNLVGKNLRILGYSVESGRPKPGATLTVAVYYQPLGLLDRDWSTSLQVFDKSGNKIAQGDDHVPGGMTYPSSLWRSGETLRDEFAVSLPVDLAPGEYKLCLRFYDSATDEVLGDLNEIGSLRVRVP